ncbi:MAG: helix-turn-helix domain-containing protein [Rhodocyclaceae bacterium]|nr:helix-turn-helix domain-containing protein [Rhodocyclaceae bacterium]
MFEIRRLIHQLRQGASNREVARALGVGRNTVARITERMNGAMCSPRPWG